MERKKSTTDFIEIENLKSDYEAMGKMLDNQLIVSDDKVKEVSKESLRSVMGWYRNQWQSNLVGGSTLTLAVILNKEMFSITTMIALIVVLFSKAVLYFVIDRFFSGADLMNCDMISSARKVDHIKKLGLIGDIVSYSLMIPLIVFLSIQFRLEIWGVIIISATVIILFAIRMKESSLRNRHLGDIISDLDTGMNS